MKSPVLKSRLAIAVLLLAPALGACGFGAQTDQPYQAAVGSNSRTGDVWIENALIVSGSDGSGTFAGTLVDKTGQAAELTSVTGDGIKAELAAGEPLKVAAYGVNNLGEAGDTVPPAKLTVSGGAAAVAPGKWVTLTFTFNTGVPVTMKVQVVPVTDDYANVPLPEQKKPNLNFDKPSATPTAE